MKNKIVWARFRHRQQLTVGSFAQLHSTVINRWKVQLVQSMLTMADRERPRLTGAEPQNHSDGVARARLHTPSLEGRNRRRLRRRRTLEMKEEDNSIMEGEGGRTRTGREERSRQRWVQAPIRLRDDAQIRELHHSFRSALCQN